MNIPKEAYELAQKGGWSPIVFVPSDRLQPQDAPWQVHVLDPKFFQALGKALGWEYKLKRGHHIDDRQTDPVEREKIAREWGIRPDWQHYARDFYDLILTGQSTEKFWKEILK